VVHIVTTGSKEVKTTHFTTTLPLQPQTAVSACRSISVCSIYLSNLSVTVRSLPCKFPFEVPLNIPHAHFTAHRLQPLTHCQIVRTVPHPNSAASAGPVKPPYPNVYSMYLNHFCTPQHCTAVTAPIVTKLTVTQRTTAKISCVAFHRGRKIAGSADMG
jgi:hypothetical protein